MNHIRKSNLIHTLAWLAVLIFCFVVPIVYYRYSHGVTSYYMTYAFLLPGVGGFLPYLFLTLFGYGIANMGRTIYQCGIATLTLGFLVTGGIDIYGTTSSLTKWYFLIGSLTSLVGLIWSIIVNYRTSQNMRRRAA